MSEDDRVPIKEEFRGTTIEVGHRVDNPDDGTYEITYYQGYDVSGRKVKEKDAEVSQKVLGRRKRHAILRFDLKGDILRRKEIFAKNGVNLQELIECNEHGKVVSETIFQVPETVMEKASESKVLSVNEYEYDEDGKILQRRLCYTGERKRLVSAQSFNILEKLRSHTSYDTDGVTVIGVIDYEYDQNGKQRLKTEYFGARSKIDTIEYFDEMEVLEKEKLYQQDGRTLKGERLYHKNGKKKNSTVYRDDGYSVFKEIEFDLDGKRKSEESYSYLPNSNKIISSKIKEYDPSRQNFENPEENLIYVSMIMYDLETGNPYKGQLLDASGAFLDYLFFNPRNGEKLDTAVVLSKRKMWQRVGGAFVAFGVSGVFSSVFVSGSIISFMALGFFGVLMVFYGIDVFSKAEDKAIEWVSANVSSSKRQSKKKDHVERDFEPGSFDIGDEMKGLLQQTPEVAQESAVGDGEKEGSERKKEEAGGKEKVDKKEDKKEKGVGGDDQKKKEESKSKEEGDKKEKVFESTDLSREGEEKVAKEKAVGAEKVIEKPAEKAQPKPPESVPVDLELKKFKEDYFKHDKKAESYLYQKIMAEASGYRDAGESRAAKKAFDRLRKMGDDWNTAFESRRRREDLSQAELYERIVAEEKAAGVSDDQATIGNFIQEYQMFHKVMRERVAASVVSPVAQKISQPSSSHFSHPESHSAPPEDFVLSSEDFEG